MKISEYYPCSSTSYPSATEFGHLKLRDRVKTVFMTFLGTVCTLGVLGFPAFKWCIE